MRILVTGGAGFIGSQIVDALRAEDHQVRVLDSLRASVHPTHPDYLDPSVDLIEGDVTNPIAVASALRGVDAVCHQAAKVGLGRTTPTSRTTFARMTSGRRFCSRS